MYLKHILIGLTLTNSVLAANYGDFKSLGITPSVQKIEAQRLKALSYPEDQYLLKVSLGKLTQVQFNHLKGVLGGKSQVPFNAQKDYSLIDFLPPFAQATVNKVLVPQRFDTEAVDRLMNQDRFSEDENFWALRKNGLESMTNCWNTTIELLRSLKPSGEKNLFFYWPGRWETNDLIRDDASSTKIKPQDIKPGDVMIVAAKSMHDPSSSMIQHTAWVVSQDIVFEKTDSSENDPYRLALREDLLNKYKTLLGEDLVIEYRRYKASFSPAAPGDALEAVHINELKKIFSWMAPGKLAAGCEERMGGGCDMVFTVIEKGSLITDPKTGRGVLNASPGFKARLQSM